MPTKQLTVALGDHLIAKILRDQQVELGSLRCQFVDVPLRTAFQSMVDDQRFDISEMAVTTAIAAVEYPQPFVALPIFLARSLPFSAITHHVRTGVTEPKDLRGRKIGIRAITATGPFWVRGILSRGYGVGSDDVTWVSLGDDYIHEIRQPTNVEIDRGGDLTKLLLSGEIAAAVNADSTVSADIQPLFRDPREAAHEWLKATGIYPLNHILVVKRTTVEEDPMLPAKLLELFMAATDKAIRIGQLDAPPGGSSGEKYIQDEWGPLRHGIEPNRVSLEAAINFAVEQHILSKQIPVEELFVRI